MLSNRLTLPLLTLLICSLQAGEVSAMTIAQTTSQTASATAATKPLIGGTPAASSSYFEAQKVYPDMKALLDQLKEKVAKGDSQGLQEAEQLFPQLKTKHAQFKQILQGLSEENLDLFVTLIQSDSQSENVDKTFSAAQSAIDALEKKLLQQLESDYNQLEHQCNQGFKDQDKELLIRLLSRCTALEERFKKIPGQETHEYVGKLGNLQRALTDKIEALTKAEKDAAEAKKLANEEAQREKARIAAEEAQRQAAELARQNRFWYKITRGKYALPMIAALSVAVVGLTYGETKHKFISKLIWGKQPEKVVQLSWWARNWGWFKRLFRLHA